MGSSSGARPASTTPQERFDLAACAKEVVGNPPALIVGTGVTRTEDSVADSALLGVAMMRDAIAHGLPPEAARRAVVALLVGVNLPFDSVNGN